MKTYISILRGINVSGYRMIKMDSLRAMYESLGLISVRTYIQSGNVIFNYKSTSSTLLKKKIQESILKEFGFEVPVIVKEKTELMDIIKGNPFINDDQKNIDKLHVTFLSHKPEKENFEKINASQYLPDEFILVGSVIYLYCPIGYGNTKLNNGFFENKLKVIATTRNWKTVNELIHIANGF